LELVRRAGGLLERLASNPMGKARFTPELELRLLSLATSRVLDATVAQLLSGALFNLPTPPGRADRKKLLPELPSPARVLELLKSPEHDQKEEIEREEEKKETKKSPTEQDHESPAPSSDGKEDAEESKVLSTMVLEDQGGSDVAV